jgi:Xaa-Pro aminopeptidase
MTFARGSSAVDWEHRHDFPGLRQARVERVRSAMIEAGFEALLVWRDENVRYLTSLRAQLIAGKSGSLNGALLGREGPPILLCSGGEVDRVREDMPWIERAVAIPIIEQRPLIDAFVAGTLVDLLASIGVTTGPVGIDQSAFSLVESIRNHLPSIQLLDGDGAMQQARRIKLDAEIALIEEACAIADAVTQRALDESRAGRRECEIAGDAMQTLYYLGGELPHVVTPFVASGERMSPPTRFCTDKIVRDGDLVFIDIGAMWNGYFGDIGRCTVVGRPSQTQQRIYTAVHRGLMAGIAQMRPGRTNADMASAVVSTVEEFGFGDRLLSLFIGHGIGIGSNEPPYLGETLPGSPTFEFEPNMVFAVEPLVWVPDVPGGGGVRIEDMVLVTEGEPRILSRAPYEERLLLE